MNGVHATRVPLNEQIDRAHNSHACHSLNSKVHINVEKSHVSNEMEVEAFEDIDHWDTNHWSSTEKQEVIKHDQETPTYFKVLLFHLGHFDKELKFFL